MCWFKFQMKEPWVIEKELGAQGGVRPTLEKM